MSDGKKTVDSPDEKSVGSRDPKGAIPKEPVEGSAGESDGVMGTAGDVKQQDNPTSYPAG
jgi:hypothetical protein